MNKPKVSIVMPVYNVEEYLKETVECLKNQTLGEFEVIFVDDGSTDKSVSILEEYCVADPRFRLVKQQNAGAGAARNIGIEHAEGDYISFLDSDDLFEKNLLAAAYKKAVETGADIVAYDFNRFDTDGKVTSRKGVHIDWLGSEKDVFNYRDCPDTIMSIVNPTPWNKLYRRGYVVENGLKFEEIFSTNDITFAAVSVARAEKVAYLKKELVRYRIGHSGTITSTKTKNLNNIIVAVESAVRQANEIPYADEIRNSIVRFAVENYIFALEHYIVDFNTEQVKRFYDFVHEKFNGEMYENVSVDTLHNAKLCRSFSLVKKYDYETLRDIVSHDLVVSFTTYPKRIGTISKVVENMQRQTRKPDRVLLYLAEEQFPGKENELSEDLMKQAAEGLVEIKWCDNLRSHKKYFYAMQEYSDSLIVTVDDDLIYPDDMLQTLYDSYIENPDCVSAMRAHVCFADQSSNEIMPYSVWVKEYRSITYCPSSQLFATSGAGTLYPPRVLHHLAFSKEKFLEICPFADDIWLHIMSVINGRRTVLAGNRFYLRYIEGTQEETLQNINVENNQNEVQYDAVRDWLKEEFGEDIVYRMLVENAGELRCANVREVCQICNEHFNYYNNELRGRLNQAWKDKAERGTKIKELSKKVEMYEIELARRDRWKVVTRMVRAFKRHGIKKTGKIALRRIRRILHI